MNRRLMLLDVAREHMAAALGALLGAAVLMIAGALLLVASPFVVFAEAVAIWRTVPRRRGGEP